MIDFHLKWTCDLDCHEWHNEKKLFLFRSGETPPTEYASNKTY